eukprot:3546569-Pyramimonas_sp.AAC.1
MPSGAPLQAPGAAPACGPTRHVGTPLIRFAAPHGAPPKAPIHRGAGPPPHAIPLAVLEGPSGRARIAA